MVQPHSLPVQDRPESLVLLEVRIQPRLALDELGAWTWTLYKPHPHGVALGDRRGRIHLAEGVAGDRAEAARIALAAVALYQERLVDLARAYDLEDEDDEATGAAAGGEA